MRPRTPFRPRPARCGACASPRSPSSTCASTTQARWSSSARACRSPSSTRADVHRGRARHRRRAARGFRRAPALADGARRGRRGVQRAPRRGRAGIPLHAAEGHSVPRLYRRVGGLSRAAGRGRVGARRRARARADRERAPRAAASAARGGHAARRFDRGERQARARSRLQPARGRAGRLCGERRAPHLFPLPRRRARADRPRFAGRGARGSGLRLCRGMDLVRRGGRSARAGALRELRLCGARREPARREAEPRARSRAALLFARCAGRRGARGADRAMAEADLAGQARSRSVQCASPKGLHRMAYLEWGEARNQDVVVCVHGLTRTGRDFDALARALCGRFRVVCPDVAGRGDSERLPDPMLYGVPQYAADMVTLIARLDVESVSWVGTSMGGLIGMALAAQAGSPVKRMVLNDVGPVITKASLERIASYVGKAPNFASVEEAERYIRAISAPFGSHSDAQWRFLTETWLRRNDDGTWRAHYDPRIGEPRLVPQNDLELWNLYDAMRCPTLLVRGELSDLLARQTAAEMAQRGPRAKVVEIRGVGHAPTLLHPDQIAVVRDFLLQGT